MLLGLYIFLVQNMDYDLADLQVKSHGWLCLFYKSKQISEKTI